MLLSKAASLFPYSGTPLLPLPSAESSIGKPRPKFRAICKHPQLPRLWEQRVGNPAPCSSFYLEPTRISWDTPGHLFRGCELLFNCPRLAPLCCPENKPLAISSRSITSSNLNSILFHIRILSRTCSFNFFLQDAFLYHLHSSPRPHRRMSSPHHSARLRRLAGCQLRCQIY